MDCRGTRWKLSSVTIVTLGKSDQFVQMASVVIFFFPAVTMTLDCGKNAPRIWTKVVVIASLSTA